MPQSKCLNETTTDIMKTTHLLCSISGIAAFSVQLSYGQSAKADNERPNILLIMVDDMGYSDLGCFGSEIPTPNIDKLAENGIRYTQFYNTARSCPTRASLMTGLYPHQAGIGEMTEGPVKNSAKERISDAPHGYKGYLNRNCVTLAEVLKEAGYHTYMTGKWHLGIQGMDKLPLQRGFDRYYGILSGASSYFKPQGSRGLTLDNEHLPPPEQPYYTTDAFTDYAISFIDGQQDENPFFLYVAYNAPHWPLHAKPEDIEKFKGVYDKGWESIQAERFRRMIELGIVDENQQLAEWESRKWEELTEKEQYESALRMSVYAAQIHAVDYNVGKLVSYLKEKDKLDNTLIIFLSDNGACAEPYSETGSGTVDMINNFDSWNPPSYGLPWAQVSNTPLRKYKVRAYEGGISTPLILSWNKKYSQYSNEWRSNVAFLPDLMATFIDVANATYPKTYHGGNDIIPLEGKSLTPTVTQPGIQLHEYIYGEHFDNRFVRWGKWKAVKDEKGSEWELYDIENDRTERYNLADANPQLVKQLADKWQIWADTHYVYPKK